MGRPPAGALAPDVFVPGKTPDMHRTSWRLAAAFLVIAAACRPEFKLKNFTTNDALYKASLSEFQRRKWDNAVAGFEKLTTDLPARDTLLPRSYWFLASAHEHLDEHLLAAQSYNRLVESFPEDSLADDAALEAARSYRKLWRNPELDPTYGFTALATYNVLIGLYPDSPLIPKANAEIAELNEWFAQKDFKTGEYYFRRKAWDSANISYKDILTKYPDTPTARRAALRLVQSYRAIRYNEDAAELCGDLRKKYPGAGDVTEVCRGISEAPATRADTTPPPVKPPAPR
jgi:outer membrane protein assembly factor BamD